MIEDFQDVQPIAYRIIKNALQKQQFSHAYLIEANGYNRTYDFCIAMAKEMICSDKNFCFNQNEKKSIYQKIDSGNYLDLKYIEPEGQWIKKEQLEELQKEFNKKPLLNSKKIYIINHADRLNVSSSNSILKFLEEPEEGIIAILIVDSVYQLLETISSRCQILRLVNKKEKNNNKAELEILLEYFNEKSIEFQENYIKKISVQIEKVVNFIEQLEMRKKDVLLDTYLLWHDTFQDKEGITFAFMVLLLYYKDVLNFKCSRELEVFIEHNSIQKISNKNTVIQIIDKMKIILKLKKNIDVNVNNSLLLDQLILEFGKV